MSNIRLFYSESLSINLEASLDKSQSHYLSKVMRINIGQSFSLFNQSGEWEAKIKEINKGIVEFSVIKKLRPKSFKNGNVIDCFVVTDNDQIILVSDKGQIIRVNVKQIRIAGRSTKGVSIFKIPYSNNIVSVSRIQEIEN